MFALIGETKSNFIERYPDIKIVENIYTINANGLMFAAGGISTLDLILECIKKIKGKDYSDEIAHALIYRPREISTMQKVNNIICQWTIYAKNQF